MIPARWASLLLAMLLAAACTGSGSGSEAPAAVGSSGSPRPATASPGFPPPGALATLATVLAGAEPTSVPMVTPVVAAAVATTTRVPPTVPAVVPALLSSVTPPTPSPRPGATAPPADGGGSPIQDPPDATARCRDGAISYAKTTATTCSGHDGVLRWINRPS